MHSPQTVFFSFFSPLYVEKCVDRLVVVLAFRLYLNSIWLFHRILCSVLFFFLFLFLTLSFDALLISLRQLVYKYYTKMVKYIVYGYINNQAHDDAVGVWRQDQIRKKIKGKEVHYKDEIRRRKRSNMYASKKCWKQVRLNEDFVHTKHSRGFGKTAFFQVHSTALYTKANEKTIP